MVKLYNTFWGRYLLRFITLPFISNLAGKILDSRISCVAIKPFIKSNNIDMSDFVYEKWSSFNDFFTRKVKDGARPIDINENSFISPCDGLLSIYNIDEKTIMNIKGSYYTVASLLNNKELANDYKNGLCFVYRLTPAHYHRYCYFDSGFKGQNIHIKGVYHTVQPFAVENMPVYRMNTREYTILNTDNFNKVIFMEVGALMVGRICNYHNEYKFKRGDEKGRFEFGGSTIIVIVKENTVKVNKDILEHNGEFPVKMGEKIGISLTK